MPAAIPVLGLFVIHETNVRLVHKCRSLKSLARLLVWKFLGGQAAQLVVDKGLNDTEIATALGVTRRTVQRYING
jgi:hypothetical protein